MSRTVEACLVVRRRVQGLLGMANNACESLRMAMD